MVRPGALLAALVLVLTGCQAGAEQEPQPTPAPVLGGAGVPGPGAGLDYVALGDSFSAGPFIGTMRTDPEGCARSRDNYPAFLADWLDVASYTDVTCSGAVTSDLYDQMRLLDGNTAPPQLDALSPDTDLVTLGIGGNDFGIYSALLRCQDSSAGISVCPVATLEKDARRVAGRIAAAVRRIARAAPDADVLVVGYPDILPPEGTCRAVGVSAEQLGPVVGVSRLLNRSLRRGAERSGATYVDVEAASVGHDVCAGARSWINGPRFRAGVAAPFHPKINGMRGVAATVYRQITGEEPDVDENAEPDPAAVVTNQP